MNDVYVHLTQVAQRCATALGIANADQMGFDDCFMEVLSFDPANEDGVEVSGMLYEYANLYGRLSHARHINSLTKNLTQKQSTEYEALMKKTYALRAKLAKKVKGLQGN